MKQIFTKTGDEGMTSLRNGVRVAKDDLRIETNGQVDHLNSLLGVVRTMLPPEDENSTMIESLQHELMAVMSHIATPEGCNNARPLHSAMLTEQMEQAIAQHRPDNIPFVIPGSGSTLSAVIHLARTQSRTVERRLWTLHRQYSVDRGVLVMMNRLSDYLFVLAELYIGERNKETRSKEWKPLPNDQTTK